MPRHSTAARQRQQVPGVIETIHAKARFGEQVGVSSLPAGNVEHARADGQPEQRDEARDLRAVLLEREQGVELPEILLVEVRRPPFSGGSRLWTRATAQKKTGSR